jgi:hypothetical protein
MHSENGHYSDLGPKRQMRARFSRSRPDLVGFVPADCLRSGLPDPGPSWGRLRWSKAARPAHEDVGMPSTAHDSPMHCRSSDDTFGWQSLQYSSSTCMTPSQAYTTYCDKEPLPDRFLSRYLAVPWIQYPSLACSLASSLSTSSI